MQVKNISARAWNIGGTFISPLETVEIEDSFKSSVVGNDELEIIAAKAGRPAAKVDQE